MNRSADPQTRRARRRGLSVVEALVAVAILAAALAPLLAIQAQGARQAIRQAELSAQASATRNAIAVLRAVNPMLEPIGVRDLGPDGEVSWRAEPRTRAAANLAESGEDGDFTVALYRIEVRARGPEPASAVAFVIEQVGWAPRVADTPGPQTSAETAEEP